MPREYTQVLLGLRSLLIKVAVFVVLAAALAWFVGGSIFPGSQVVNCPAVEWAGSHWHAQVMGNGRRPAPVEWRIIRSTSTGDSEAQSLGVAGTWRQMRGPVVTNGTLCYGIESDNEGVSKWWIVSIDADGKASAVEAPASRVLSLAPSLDGAPR